MNILGIDPGLGGALALISANRELLHLVDMPTLTVTKSRRQIDTAALSELLRVWHESYDVHVVIERAIVLPNQGASSGFKTGIGFGQILGILAAIGVGHEIIQAKQWQTKLFGKVERGTAKDHARAYASRMYPHADLGKRKTQDRSDAICIALWGFQGWGISE